MRHITMNIENHVLEDIGYSASIEYWKDDKGLMVKAQIHKYDSHFNEYFRIDEKEFNTMEDAINYLEIECADITIAELNHRAFKGRRAQERLDEIKEEGFKL